MGTGSKTVVFYVTRAGHGFAKKIAELYPGAKPLKFRSGIAGSHWNTAETLVFVMAAGIVVREIAPLIRDKKTDPAVVVLDEKGEYAVSLLSGHFGGANERAREIAAFLSGQPVITTASDVNELPSIDLWAREQGLAIENWDQLPKAGTTLINRRNLFVHSDIDLPLPEAFASTEDPDQADVIISHRMDLGGRKRRNPLFLRPRDLVLGIGCNSGTTAEEIEKVVSTVLDEEKLSFLSVRNIATIDRKGNEPGLVAFAGKFSLPLVTFTPEELNRVENVTVSSAAEKATGAKAVAEPAAMLAAEAASLIVPKQKRGNVTVAVAVRSHERSEGSAQKKASSRLTPHPSPHAGKIFVVGTGPGSAAHITPSAQEAIRRSDVIVGYGTYLDLIQDLISDKEVVSTGMTQEIDRCRKAIELATEGRTVAVISGGDPGIYAMAGLVLELLKNQGSSLDMEIVPGISALNACAARLGAPLMHDFAAISLSDRLTPWETIQNRLDAAAMADFVIALYNPKSKGRKEQIGKAREIILRHRSPATPVGLVKGAMREDERVVITNLEEMLDHEIDMQTTVIIGNSHTVVWNNLMITPRGYEKKKQYQGK